MNTIFCKNCGQANLSNTYDCTKCGMKLEQAGNNPGGQKSAAATTSTTPSKSGGNKLYYWILGGVGALVLLFGFFVVALAAGIYIYTGQDETVFENTNTESNSDVKTDKKQVDNKSKDTDNKSVTAKNLENEDLESFIKTNYQNIGNFKLQSVSDVGTKDKKVFRGSNDEAFAIYSSDEKNPLEILFSLANFKTISDAKVDVAAIKIKTIVNKGKIIKENKLKDGVIITYREKNLIGILDCKNKVCVRVIGADNNKVADFYRQVAFK